MNKFFILILISLFTAINAQQSKNRFEEEGQSGFERPVVRNNEDQVDNPQPGPGNPGEPVPIDQYGGLLVIAGVAIILYTTKKKTNLLSSK